MFSSPRVLIASATLVAAACAATASAADAPEPLPKPAAGCATFTDPAEDATAFALDPSLPPGPNDPDLDITSVVLATPPGKIRAYIKVSKLDVPAYGVGHAFFVSFVHNGKKVELSARQDVSGADEAHQAGEGAPFVQSMSSVTYDAAPIADAKVDAVFDTANSTVVLTTDRAPIEKAAKAPLDDGVAVTKPAAQSANDEVLSNLTADTANAQNDYTIGDNSCFGPPKAKLAVTAPGRAVAGHTVTVTGTLTDEADKPQGSKSVHVTVGSASADAITNESGAFSAAVRLSVAAGVYDTTTTFAGDDSLQTVTTSAKTVVSVQPTRTTLTAAASGSAVLLTAQLVDDLKAPVVGKTITWFVDGKATRTTRTDAKGRATFSAQKKHAIKAVYAGDKSRYAASQAARNT
jgi:hypothetical protein